MLAKAQASARAITEHQNSSPSPTTILKTVNSSGHYMCSQRSNDIEMPFPTVFYHEPSPITTTSSFVRPQNMMQHRNNVNIMCHQQDNGNQFEYDENDENSSHQQQQFHNYNYSQIQHPIINESQQQEDQHTIELRMNNLGNEDTG